MSKKVKPATAVCCTVENYCSVHGYTHGAEAEELREAIEAIVEDLRAAAACSCCGNDPSEELADSFTRMLDNIDARDSLAYVQLKSARKARAK